MSDEKLRALERRWKETGAVEDEAAYLLERVRTGDLDRNMLKLASYCGHTASLLVLEKTLLPVPENIKDWVRKMHKWGKMASVRAAVEAASFILNSYEKAYPHDPQPRLAIQSACEWTICPCEKHRAAESSAEAARAASTNAAESAAWACNNGDGVHGSLYWDASNAAMAAGYAVELTWVADSDVAEESCLGCYDCG